MARGEKLCSVSFLERVRAYFLVPVQRIQTHVAMPTTSFCMSKSARKSDFLGPRVGSSACAPSAHQNAAVACLFLINYPPSTERVTFC